MCGEGVFCWFFFRLLDGIALRRQNRPPELCFGARKPGFYWRWRVFLCGEGVIAGFSSDYLTKPPSGDEITLQGQYRPPMTELPSGEGDGVFDPRIGEDANENN